MKKVIFVLGLLALVASQAIAGGPSSLQPLYNNQRLILGYLDHSQQGRTVVRDACSIMMGYTTSQGTFTMTGVRLSPSPIPYMLLTQGNACTLTKQRMAQ